MRPVPIISYVNWLIALNNLPDAPPIGSIVAFGGDMTDVGVRSAVNAAEMVCVQWR